METIKFNFLDDKPKNYTGIVEYSDGKIIYYLNGKWHREDGPAIIWNNSDIEYYLNGKLHREDGPAVIWNDGIQKYYLNGKCHRVDGPAVIRKDGIQKYYINDKDITDEVNEWIIENNIPKDWNNSHKILFKLIFG